MTPRPTATVDVRRISGFLNSRLLHIALICLLGLIVYSNTFHAPFQWDEFRFIKNNPIVKDLGFFMHPSTAAKYPLYGALKSRYIGYLTFALDYRIHGFHVTGYHIVNLCIHLVNAVLVYFLVLLSFRTPFLARSSLRSDSAYVALFTALFFVSHPLQTEAVTYIFQRLASLVTMFYLLSIVMYIEGRLRAMGKSSPDSPLKARHNPPSFPLNLRGDKGGVRFNIRDLFGNRLSTAFFYFLSVLFAVLAMKTKENAFTLPVMILLYEFFFFRGRIRSRLAGLIPILVTLFVIPLSMMDVGKTGVLNGIEAATSGAGMSRSQYFFTQMRVIVTYIRLLFFPLNQNIGYDYPLFRSLGEMPVLLSFVFLLAILCLAAFLFLRSRAKPDLRIIAFGIAWFFISLSVESSIVPIQMVIDEYRVYLPSVGIFFALSTGLFLMLGSLRERRRLAISLALLLIVSFSITAYVRNSEWGSRISLWEDAVKKAPGQATAHYNLAHAFKDKGLLGRAIGQYREAIRLEPYYAAARDNLGLAYDTKGLVDEAIEQYRIAVMLNPGNAEAHYNLGLDLMAKGMVDEAVREYRTAIKYRPDYVDAYNNLGNAYMATGLVALAMKQYRTAVRFDPNCMEAHYNLGMAYLNRKDKAGAVREFEEVLRIDPGNSKARSMIGYAQQLK